MTLLNIDTLHLLESAVKSKNSDDGLKTWSTAIQILLPVAALAILWGRRGFFARFFLQFDKNCVAVFCPSFSKRERLLKWASGRLPQTWSSHSNTHLAEFWRDGSLLCTLINSAIPGACPNPHRHWRRPPSHGQALAYKYLGVIPIFTESELTRSTLTSQHERVLLNYLLQIQQAITKISIQEFKFSSCYVARGMGLVSGDQHQKTSFYIYSNSSSADHEDVMVSIRGPYNTYNTVTVPSRYILRKPLHLKEKRRLAYQSRSQRSFLRSLSVDLGSFINTGQKQNIEDEIPLQLVREKERVKVVYIPRAAGIHEVSIITNGFHLTGSPFTVNVAENTTKASDDFTESEKAPYRRHDAKSIRRRIISKIIDFIDEKVTCENLKSLPMYVRNIPQINIVQAKNKDEEEQKEDALNKQPSEENCASSTTANQEDILADANTRTHSTTNTDKATINTLPHLNIPPKPVFAEIRCDPEPNESDPAGDTTNQESDPILNLAYPPDADVDQAFEINDYEYHQTSNNKSFNLCDSNNNTPVFKTKDSDSLSQAESDKTFITSPICDDHIENEVNGSVFDCTISSEIPNGNFKKTVLRKQSKVDGHCDTSSESEIKLEDGLSGNGKVTEAFKINQTDTSENTEMCIKLEDVQSNFHVYKQDCFQTDTKLETKSVECKIIASALMRNSVCETATAKDDYKRTESLNDLTVARNQKMLESDESQIKLSGSRFPQTSKMNILNYLSSLKGDNSTSSSTSGSVTPSTETCDEDHPSLQYSPSLDTTTMYRLRKEPVKNTFKERLYYWESQINLSITDKRTKFKHRRSLPNLFSFSGTGLVFFPSIDDCQNNKHTHDFDNLKLQTDNKATKCDSLFRERQRYWRELSSQTVSYSSSSCSLYYLENSNKYTNRNRFRARRSLPNLFSEAQRQELYYNQALDFYDSPDVLKFRSRFKECREYWENLSSLNLIRESRASNLDSCENLYYSDDNFDSGFCSGLPNLWIKSRQEHLDSLTDDFGDFRFKRQYKERREYWKRLSSQTQNNVSSNGFHIMGRKHRNPDFPKRERLLEQPESDIVKQNQQNFNEKKINSKCKQGQKQQKLEIKEYSSKDGAFSKGVVALNKVGNSEETNLTDDLKSIGDQREKMRMHFLEAQEFFKTLERDSIRKES